MSDPRDDAVRRLLAEARHTEPVPPEVAERLEQTLARLQAEDLDVSADSAEPTAPTEPTEPTESGAPTDPAPAPGAEVADLAVARRLRRHRRATLLGAAAAVVVAAAIAVPATRAVLDSGSSDETASGGSAADSAADSGADSGDQSGDESSGAYADGDAAPSDSLDGPESTNLRGARGVPVIRADHLRADVERALSSAPHTDSLSDLSATVYGCSGPLPPGRLLPVRYDGARAVLAASPERATLYRCSGTGAERLRTIRR